MKLNLSMICETFLGPSMTMIVHSLQMVGTRVVPGLGLNGLGAGHSTKLVLPSIIST